MSGVPGFDDDEGTPTDDVGAGQPRARRWLRRTIAVLAVVVVVSLAAGFFYAFTLQRSVSANLQRVPDLLPSDSPSSSAEAPRPTKPTTGRAANSINVVLMGSDSRDTSDSGAGRSDVLMVAHLDADRKQAYVVSFPRDMWVAIPDHGKAKINAAFAYGGPKLTVRTLEGLLDTRMDHVALMDFEGFVNLTKDLGGVTVTNKYASTSQGFHFPVGKITIQGDQALAYVRERHQLPHGDLDRAQRQRIVVQAILAKGLSGDTITNPAKFKAFVTQLSTYMQVDDSLTDAELRKVALSLRLTGSDVQLLQAPIAGFGTIRGQSVDVVDEPRLKELAEALKDDDMASYLEKYPRG
ncbi:MAG: LCP family protein [Propionibacteriaceae bacterium]